MTDETIGDNFVKFHKPLFFVYEMCMVLYRIVMSRIL